MDLKRVSRRLLLFVPAPGNCHQIPRKFVRDLNGRPLLSYSIDLATQSTDPSNVVVISDDEEVLLIARRMRVDSVLVHDPMTFPKGFGEPITMAKLRRLEESNGHCYDAVVWLGPSSPFVRERDIVDALDYLCSDPYADSVFTVSVDPQRNWVYDRTYQPSFQEVPNSLANGVMHKETGAFFIMKRTSIGEGGYEGRVGKPFFLHETHALEIHNLYDWWVAEKLLRRRQILFVVRGHAGIGMGHVYRSLLLAEELTDHQVQFLCAGDSHLAYEYISKMMYPVFLQQENKALLDCVLELSPDLVVNDILDTDGPYVCGLKERGVLTMNFEDEGNGAEFADVVINALYESPKYKNMLVGDKYFCLRSEFLSAPKYTVRDRASNVLLSFGGTDHAGLTLRTLRIIAPHAVRCEFYVTVVLGAGYEHGGELDSFLEGLEEPLRERVKVVANGTRQISEYMLNCDVAVTSAGRTVLELAALRVPGVVIAANERELSHSFARKAGMEFLGLHSNVSDSDLESCVLKLIRDNHLRGEISAKLGNYDLSRGKEIVARIIKRKLEETWRR